MLTEKQMKSIPPLPFERTGKLVYNPHTRKKEYKMKRGSWSNSGLNRKFPDQKRNKTFAELLNR